MRPTVEEIYARKAAARLRFAGMTLIEKVDAMAELRRNLDQCFGQARRDATKVDRKPE